MKYFDHEGTERNETWLSARFGLVTVRTSTAESAFRAVELRESIGPAVYVVKVLDENGRPMDQEQVARTWPDPQLPVLPENEWYIQGVYGPTNVEGDIGFGSGGGDVYWPEDGQQGASSFWVLEFPSDCIEGIGTLADHHAHLDMTFGWVEGNEPPPPPPPPSPPPPPPTECTLDVEAFMGALETAIDALRTAGELVAESHANPPPP